MSRFGELLGSRHAPHWAVLALMSVGFGGCSADTQTRFTDNPSSFKTSWSNWSNPFSSTKPALESTGSVPQQRTPELPQYARPQTTAPVVSAPLSYPSVPVAQTGGGRGLASYTPQTSSPIESTGSVKPRSVAATPAYKPEGGTTIIVGTSDTLDIIAKRYNVPSSEILAANGYGGPRVLQPGQQLIIPKRNVAAAAPIISSPATTPVATAATSVHVVNPGDTLSNVARRNHITPGHLAAANHLPVTSQLKIGSKLTVPGGRVAAAPEISKPQVVAQAPVTKQSVVAAAPVEPVQKAALANDKIDLPESSPVKAADATNGLPSFRWPVRGRVITTYGAKTNGKSNDGINVAVPEGTPVKAAEDGTVAYSGNELKGYGNLILVRHANGYVTAYAHASELLVKRGDTIKRGQIIAKSGQTGEVGSPQLHFEIRKGSSAVDPLQFLNGA